MGCKTLRIGSPQFHRAPEIRCIVIIQTDEISALVAAMALNACKEAIELPAPKEPAK
jgi:hypothetical protein